VRSGDGSPTTAAGVSYRIGRGRVLRCGHGWHHALTQTGRFDPLVQSWMILPMRRLPYLIPLTVAGLLTAATSTASAAGLSTITDWELNESAGAAVMHDSSANGINGSIGSDVVTGVTYNGASGYRFPYVEPSQLSGPEPQRLVQVDGGQLNPGTRDFAVTIRYRTGYQGQNLLQKGQAATSGGDFKLDSADGGGGVLDCMFRGPQGRLKVTSVKSLDDGQWHTVRCERTSSAVTMMVDGTVTDRQSGWTGNISNSVPLTIGGKLDCNATTVDCDYFAGDINYVSVQAG
jgi:hypothetical protein